MRFVVFLFGVIVVFVCIMPAAFAEDTPTAAFSNTTVCQGLPTQFTNNSSTLSGGIIASIWDFGDGQGSSVFSPEHTYATSGTFSVTLTVIDDDGDVGHASASVTVHPSGNLNFVITSPNNCESSTFGFTNLSNIVSGNFTSQSWDFGDGASVNSVNASHQYSAPGTYTVTLTTLTNNSCSKSFSKVLEVFPEADVDFQAANVCKGTETEFANLTQVASGLVSYQWNFGDGNSSTLSNPSHEFGTANSFNVILEATTDHGCITNISKQVVTHPLPVVNFAVVDHCFGVNASFDNTSSIAAGTLTHSWQFGDGTTSTNEDSQHTYAAIGNYPVTLTVTSNQQCDASITKFVRVTPKPIVDFSVTNICLGQNASFTNGSTIAEGEIAYQWNFGDGGLATTVNPTHVYQSHGTFDVTLQASTPSGGCPQSIMKQIVVSAQPNASFAVTDNCLGTNFAFDNTSLYSGTDISYVWNFGDGQSVNGEDVNHAYTAPQTYLVSLTATAGNGCADVETKSVKVFPLPQNNFIVDHVCLGGETLFRNFSSISSGTVSYEWDFGDNVTSTTTEPVHSYPLQGTYTVKLTATSDLGCKIIKEKSTQVYPLPVVDFSAPAVCDNQLVKFTNLSSIPSGSIQRYQWDFGDETTSLIKNPSKEYLRSGSYSVNLLAFSDKGCESSVTKSVTVFPPPLANFTVSDVCAKETISVQNTSTIESGSLSYYWDFGDLSNSVATSPTHDYRDYGVYTISLKATSNSGCKDSVTRIVAIFSLPEIDAGEDVSTSQGYSVQLLARGGVEYRWEPIDALNNSSIADPVATPLVTTDFVVFGKNSFGCENSDTVRVIVNEEFKLVASNVLTPDDNGSNDTWIIENVETFGDVNVRVYDRTGRLVFRQEAYQNDWRGTAGKDLLPDGTYYYYVTFGRSDRIYKGALTIIRNKK